MSDVRGWTIKAVAVVGTVLVVGAAIGWTQQKGNPGMQTAAALAQEQQTAMQQAKLLSSAQSGAIGANPRQTGSNPQMLDTAGDVTSPSFQETIRTKRNDERQKRLESDTQRLLNLANQLKSEVAVSGAESMTPEMLHQMDEIEKLAKSVKERMRS